VIGFAKGAALRNNRIMAALMLAVVSVSWITRAPAPAVQSVNGVYGNVCCAPIQLENGVLIAGSERVPFQLVMMKFGLVAYPAKAVAIRDGHAIVMRDVAEPPGIVFDTRYRIISISSESGSGIYMFVRR
jgi:hypothetical protein